LVFLLFLFLEALSLSSVVNLFIITKSTKA